MSETVITLTEKPDGATVRAERKDPSSYAGSVTTRLESTVDVQLTETEPSRRFMEAVGRAANESVAFRAVLAGIGAAEPKRGKAGATSPGGREERIG